MKKLNYLAILAVLLTSVNAFAGLESWTSGENIAGSSSRNNDNNGVAAVIFDKDNSCTGTFFFAVSERIEWNDRKVNSATLQLKIDSSEAITISARTNGDFVKDRRNYSIPTDAEGYSKLRDAYKAGNTLYVRFKAVNSSEYGTTYIFSLDGFAPKHDSALSYCESEFNEINVW